MRPESTALNVSERIDALAAALRSAGVPPEQSARLLASAASAAMHAVTLDAILTEPAAPAAATTVVPEIAQPVRLAA
jgi:non-ribosomal peptide synthetase component F